MLWNCLHRKIALKMGGKESEIDSTLFRNFTTILQKLKRDDLAHGNVANF